MDENKMRYTPFCPFISPRLLFSSSGVLPSKRSATTHANHREREKEGVERPIERQGEKGILGVMKRREQFFWYYHKWIRQTPRLYSHWNVFSSKMRTPPLEEKSGREKKIRSGWMWNVGGPVSYNRERNRRALLGACTAPGAGCNITSHTQPPR